MSSQTLTQDSIAVSPAGTSDNEDVQGGHEGSILLSPVSKLEYKAILSRRRRRKLRQTTEFITIDGSWSEISQNFQSLYNSLLVTKVDCFECYQIILNSLEIFYQRTSAPDSDQMDIRKLVSTFLEKFLGSILADVVTLDKAISTEQHLMECELRCLLEIYLLRAFPRPLGQTNIVQKLRSLFFASNSERIKKFLNETICDEFLEDLPLSLAGIYEELFLDAPVDLHRFQSQEQIERSKPQPVQELREKNKFAFRLAEFMSEFQKTGEENENVGGKSASMAKKKNNRSRNVDASKEKLAKRKRRKVSSVSPVPSDQKKPHARRRLVHVPETPEEKLLLNVSRPCQSSGGRSDEAADRDVVPNTPIGKIRNNISDQSKIAQLVKKEEDRLMQIDLNAKASHQKPNRSLLQPVELPKDSTGVASNKTRSSNGSTSTGLVFKGRSILNASLAPSSVARRKAKRKIEFNGFSNAAKKGQMEESQGT